MANGNSSGIRELSQDGKSELDAAIDAVEVTEKSREMV
jgi:hypothetical protein